MSISNKFIKTIRDTILNEDLIEKHITNKMSYKLFLKKLKTQDKQKLYYNDHRIGVMEHDEIYYMIMEFIVTLIYQEEVSFEQNITGEDLMEMLHIWSREQLERGEEIDILFFANINYHKNYRCVINHFVYWFISKARNTHNINNFYVKEAKIIYRIFVNGMSKLYKEDILKQIAINKIKRNKIYNLGLGLKLSIKSFETIM